MFLSISFRWSTLTLTLSLSIFLIAGYWATQTAFAFLVVETAAKQHTPSSRTRTCQFLLHREQQQQVVSVCAPGRRVCSQQRHLGSSSSHHGKDSDGDGDGDTLETLSELLSQILSVTDDDDDSQHSINIDSQQEQRQREVLTTRLSNNWNHGSLNLKKKSNSNIRTHNHTYIYINRTYVDESTIANAGKGLFARRDYPKGTMLTCYPGDALVDLSLSDDDDDDNDDETDTDTDTDTYNGKGRVIWGSHISNNNNNNNATTTDDNNKINFIIRQEYMLRAIREEWGIVALPELFGKIDEHDADSDVNSDADADSDSDPSYLGHFANDGAAIAPRWESELAAYMIESADKANAMHQECEGCHMVTIATRDIAKGEEIFVTYGPEYWSEQQPSFGGSSESSDDYLDDDDDDDEEDYDFDFEDGDYDYYDDEVEAIVTEIISLSEASSESPSRGKGFG